MTMMSWMLLVLLSLSILLSMLLLSLMLMLIKMLQMTNHDNYGERLFAPSITNQMEMMRNDENLGNGKFLKFMKHFLVGKR